MNKLIISRGVSGSGKSTWANAQSDAIVVSRDAIRLMLFRDDSQEYYKRKDLRDCEALVSKFERAAVSAALNFGKTVISDNTNVEMKFVNQLAEIAYAVGVPVEIKSFADVSLSTCLERNRKRGIMGGRVVPDDVIRKQHNQLQLSKNAELTKGFSVEPYTGTPGKPKAFLYDLDGTVYHMADKRGPYDHNVDVDDPDPVVISIVRALTYAGLTAIAMSGRKTATRQTTIDCLNRDNVPFDELFMRADGDDRKDNIIKAELFDAHVRDNYDVLFVLDDRDQVVKMWREDLGIKCLQVAPGDF